MRHLLIVTAASDPRPFALVGRELRRRTGMSMAMRSASGDGVAEAAAGAGNDPPPSAVLLHGVGPSAGAPAFAAVRAAMPPDVLLLTCPDAGWLRAAPPPLDDCRAALRVWRGVTGDTARDLPVDLPGLVWLGLSLRHEALSPLRDEFGRVPTSESLFGPPDLAPIPWVDRAVDSLVARLGDMATPPHPPCRCCVTFDLDAIAKFPTGRSLARLLRTQGPGALVEWLGVKTGRRADPFTDACRFVAGKVADLDLPTTWFWMADRRHPLDPPAYLGSAPFEGLLGALPAGRTEHALHPSFRTIEEDERLGAEKAALERALDRPITTARMHYLRWDHATMPGRLAEAGILHDSTLGFPRLGGFRAGTRLPFELIDQASLVPVGVTEVPLVLMDATNAFKSRPGAEGFLAEALALVGGGGARGDAAGTRTLCGAPTVLIHPHNFGGQLGAASDAIETLAAPGGCATVAGAAAAFPV